MIDLTMEIDLPDRDELERRKREYQELLSLQPALSSAKLFRFPTPVQNSHEMLLSSPSLPHRNPKVIDATRVLVGQINKQIHNTPFIANEEERKFVHFLC
eukprot:TRINITY_DN9515_c0_g1_i4.p1 TRINITY_DN9515_c0_g1~~TRINITY_DN9515_c0_g1_i4.p1  ORF type:complete len:100 (+),score=11.09 TRINITY_DN9515_c0_g1_i4:91-390(+)